MADENVKAHYRGEEGKRYHHGKRGIPDVAIPWVSRLRSEKLRAHVRPDDVVLEYGVGSGWNLASLECKSRLGFDLSDFLAADLAKLGISFIPAPRSVADQSIDVAICHHTLEHVLNPSEVLAEMRRMLRMNGKLLLFVPFEKERRYRHFHRREPNHHLYSWNVQSLANLTVDCGFEVAQAEVGEFGYDRFAAVWADKLHLGETGFRLCRKAIHFIKPGREVRIIAEKR